MHKKVPQQEGRTVSKFNNSFLYFNATPPSWHTPTTWFLPRKIHIWGGGAQWGRISLCRPSPTLNAGPCFSLGVQSPHSYHRIWPYCPCLLKETEMYSFNTETHIINTDIITHTCVSFSPKLLFWNQRNEFLTQKDVFRKQLQRNCWACGSDEDLDTLGRLEHFLPPAEVRQAQTPPQFTHLSLLPTGLLVPSTFDSWFY